MFLRRLSHIGSKRSQIFVAIIKVISTWKHLLVTTTKKYKKTHSHLNKKIKNVKIDNTRLPSWIASTINIRDLRFSCRHGVFVLLTTISGVGFAAIPPIPSIIFHSYTSQNIRIEERKKNTTFLAILEVSTVCFKI